MLCQASLLVKLTWAYLKAKLKFSFIEMPMQWATHLYWSIPDPLEMDHEIFEPLILLIMRGCEGLCFISRIYFHQTCLSVSFIPKLTLSKMLPIAFVYSRRRQSHTKDHKPLGPHSFELRIKLHLQHPERQEHIREPFIRCCTTTTTCIISFK